LEKQKFSKLIVILFALLILVLSASSIVAHGEVDDGHEEGYDWQDPVQYIKWSSILLTVISFFLLIIYTKASESHKKLIFWTIALIVLLPTFYLAGHTVYKNVNSVTKGPVHWHADYQVWLCGEKVDLIDPKGMLNNKVGSNALHEHNDDRVHVEGVVKQLSDINLGSYFRIIGGELTSTSIKYFTNNGLLTYNNGDQCANGESKLKVYVNGKKIEKPAEYVPAPQINVPPGDCIILVFDEKDTDTTQKICDSWAAKLGGYEVKE
jgi:hypothetical protein